MKASVFIATSLDGFIARTNGDIDWLDEPASEGEDYGYHSFIEDIDFLVMGRNSYEKVLTLGEWHYTKPVIVLIRRSMDIPANLNGRVEPLRATPEELVEQLAARGAKHLYIDGGQTIQAFLNRGLIQRLIITRIPILLGEGIPLFGPLQQDQKLHHVSTNAFPNGIVQSEYEVL